LNMLCLADLGFGTAMAYSFYKPLADHDEKKLAALSQFYKKIYNIIAMVITVAGIAMTPFLHLLINTEKPIPYLQLYFLVSVANTSVSYLFSYKQSIINADQRGHLISKYGIYFNLVKTILQMIFLLTTRSYLVYLLLNVANMLGYNLLVAYQADKNYPYTKNKEILDADEKKSIFSNLKSVFIYKVSGVLLNATDNLLINLIVNTAAVGLYSNYLVVTNNLSMVAQMIYSAMTPSVGNLVTNSDDKKMYGIFRIMQMCSFWMSGFFLLGAYFLTEDFITVWIGAKYLFPHMTFIAILFNFYLGITLQPIWTFREATGLYRRTKYVMVLTAVVNLALSIILGIHFGVGGIIFASFLARISTYFWYEPNILFHDYFKRSVSSYYWGHIVNFIPLFIAYIAVYYTTSFIHVDTWLLLLAKTAICTVIVNLIYLIRYMKTDEFIYVKDRFGKAICGRLHK